MFRSIMQDSVINYYFKEQSGHFYCSSTIVKYDLGFFLQFSCHNSNLYVRARVHTSTCLISQKMRVCVIPTTEIKRQLHRIQYS